MINWNMIIYLLYNFISIFYIKCIFNIFFKSSYNLLTNFLFFLMFLLNGFIYLYFKIPALSLVSSILIPSMIIVFMYKGALLNKLATSILTMFSFVVLETVLGFALSNMNKNIFLYSKTTNTNFIFNAITFMVLVKLLSRFKNIKYAEKVSLVDWFSILVIPFSSLLIILILLTTNISNEKFIIINIVVLFLNFISFFIFDRISLYYNDSLLNEVLNAKNRMSVNQIKNMSEKIEEYRIFAHDVDKHYISIKNYAENELNNEIVNYISNISNITFSNEIYCSSNNITINSIVNYYLNRLNDSIRISCTIRLRSILQIEEYDLTIMLGNLLENAINSLEHLENGILNIEIELRKGVLFISLVNTYKETVFFDRNKFPINKNRKSYGTKNIKRITEKYGGTVAFEISSDLFSAHIILYNMKEI